MQETQSDGILTRAKQGVSRGRIDHSMEQARRAPRYNLEARIEGHAEYGISARVVDLSPSGALVESSRWLEEGSELSLEVFLDDVELTVTATVIHTASSQGGPYRTGVRFVALPAEKRDRIRSFLRRHVENERRGDPRLFVGKPAQERNRAESYQSQSVRGAILGPVAARVRKRARLPVHAPGRRRPSQRASASLRGLGAGPRSRHLPARCRVHVPD